MNIITLGIGPGSAIKYLLTAGLDIGEALVIVTPASRTATVRARPHGSATESRTAVVSGESRSS